MSFEVGLSERAQNACGQEGRGDVCRRLLHVGAEHVHDSGGRTRGGVSERAAAARSRWGVIVRHLLMLWHMRGMSLARKRRDSQ